MRPSCSRSDITLRTDAGDSGVVIKREILREPSLSWARLTCVAPIGTSWDNKRSIQTRAEWSIPAAQFKPDGFARSAIAKFVHARRATAASPLVGRDARP